MLRSACLTEASWDSNCLAAKPAFLELSLCVWGVCLDLLPQHQSMRTWFPLRCWTGRSAAFSAEIPPHEVLSLYLSLHQLGPVWALGNANQIISCLEFTTVLQDWKEISGSQLCAKQASITMMLPAIVLRLAQVDSLKPALPARPFPEPQYLGLQPFPIIRSAHSQSQPSP